MNDDPNKPLTDDDLEKLFEGRLLLTVGPNDVAPPDLASLVQKQKRAGDAANRDGVFRGQTSPPQEQPQRGSERESGNR